MKTFKDFLESEVPATTTPVMGKPDGGMVKKGKEPPVEKRKDLEEDE
ncbi:hypothetical protein HWB92_gp197 [Serratia phage vB_SmaA_3M]|uniref:Uncharacterized protein n=2 Tax=Miltonvirus TaxID=2841278 RepID=K7Z9U4_9CAUD|nr:hypothetical protein G646_gp195 [Serratia phage phiMAM1]YP_009842065.1 hypothetical protein HWB92_gp197 [Serratia phage vB_SmaA_3M]AFX93663.1 hypothetical protein MAM_195 [Serratia phage phiMAM1]AYP28455.1 hypothetical protein 3M_199c [Serratia phage vB_SmaA_3M]